MPAGLEGVEEPAPGDLETGFGPDDDADDDAADLDAEAEAQPEPEPEPVTEAEVAAAPPVPDETPAEDRGVSEPAASPDAEAAPDETEDVPGEAAGAAAAADADEEEEDEDAGPPAGLAGMVAPKRDIDQNLRAILQEEVAREMAARAAETGPSVIETATGVVEAEQQPTTEEDDADLQLIREPSKPFDDDTLADTGFAPDTDRVDVFAAAPGMTADDEKGSRKDLFPDIEEINSTLDSHGYGAEDEEETEGDERSGFGRAFFTVIAIAALLLALYLVAPKLAASVPALEPVLSGYVGAINGIRAFFGNLL